MTISALRYLWLRMRHPSLRDFLEEGLGIAARAERAAAYWRPHLQCCHEFEGDACNIVAPSPSSFTILGAGRLLDVAPDVFLRSGTTVNLVDADPALEPEWRRFKTLAQVRGSTVQPFFCEITGRIPDWTIALEQWLRRHRAASEADLASFLDSLPRLPKRAPVVPPADVVVSLNILSQIPIYWRERVLKLLRRFTPHLVGADDLLSSPAEAALARHAALLQHEHLQQIASLGRRLVLIISDVEFYYYQRHEAQWQTEPALYNLALPAIAGEVRLARSWLWHIAPQGVEQDGYGVIHKVQGFAITPA